MCLTGRGNCHSSCDEAGRWPGRTRRSVRGRPERSQSGRGPSPRLAGGTPVALERAPDSVSVRDRLRRCAKISARLKVDVTTLNLRRRVRRAGPFQVNLALIEPADVLPVRTLNPWIRHTDHGTEMAHWYVTAKDGHRAAVLDTGGPQDMRAIPGEPNLHVEEVGGRDAARPIAHKDRRW
jgi:hypothetical protein